MILDVVLMLKAGSDAARQYHQFYQEYPTEYGEWEYNLDKTRRERKVTYYDYPYEPAGKQGEGKIRIEREVFRRPFLCIMGKLRWKRFWL